MSLRENIKKELRLVTEQSSNERCMHIRACWGAITHYRFGTVNGGIPQSGQILDWMQGNRPLYVHNVFTPGDPNEPSGCSGYNQNFNLYQGTTCCPHVCGTSTSNQMLGFAGFIPSMNYAGCSGSGPMCCGNSNYNASPNSNCPSTSSCDTTPASACAQQWFANPAQPWATSFMSSNDCPTYTWFANNLEQDAINIMNDPTTPSPQPGPYNDWNDIKNAANASGLGQPEKGQFKRKMAKAKYSQCQIQTCNC